MPADQTKTGSRDAAAAEDEGDRTVEEFGAIEGGNQTVDRLEEHLAEL